MREPSTAVVWGNCQAGPLADLVRAPLATEGIKVVDVPPVYLVTAAQLEQVHRMVADGALLIAQPVRDDYQIPGCGTRYLAGLLPRSGRLVTVPIAYHVGPFPYQVHGYTRSDARVDAPLTDYHDLRALVAARHGMSPEQAVAWWPEPGGGAVRALADTSLAELRRRETTLDVAVSDLVVAPDALWTMSHPANLVLTELSRRVLRVLGIEADVTPPQRQYLAQRRAPIEPAVAEALGWPTTTERAEWTVDGASIPQLELLTAQLAFYAAHPDVVERTLKRHVDRLRAMGLT